VIALRALFAAIAFVLCVGEAWAHASLVSADPADGATLAAPPDQVVLRFSEPVSPLAVKLLDDTGAAVTLPPVAQPEGETIRVALPSQMRHGTYLLSYRVTSADSHPVAGSTAFSIGAAMWPGRAKPADAATPALGAWRIVLRALRDIALLIAAGCALFLLWVAPFPGERIVLGAAGLAAALFAVAGVGLQGAALIGHGDILAPESWRIAITTSYGLSATAAAAAALAIATAATVPRSGMRSGLLGLGAFAAGASLPLTGHAATASPGVLAVVAVAAHGLAAAFWTGSLVALLAMLRQDGGEAGPALRRFSRIATAAVAVLIAAGAGFAAMQLASPRELLHTRYGNLILAKAALFAALLAIAAYNRFVLLASMDRDASGTAAKLRCSIAAEIAIIIAVVALTAVLTQTSPREERIVNTLSAGSHTAAITIRPGRAGRNAIAVQFRDRDGRPYDPVEATLDIANPAARVEPMTRPLARAGQGDYRYEGAELAFPGRWSFEIRMRVDDFEQHQFTGSIDVR
jgi:copper transport protein